MSCVFVFVFVCVFGRKKNTNHHSSVDVKYIKSTGNFNMALACWYVVPVNLQEQQVWCFGAQAVIDRLRLSPRSHLQGIELFGYNFVIQAMQTI